MQYMLMCCIDEAQWNGLPARDRDRVMQQYGAWIQGIRESRHHLGTGKLRPSASAKTIRQAAGAAVITDGPFAETKEQLGGYHLVECRDMDEALAIARRIPTLPVGGTVEVRQLEPSL
ncbi:MAG: YciI family protein [Steroidobacteraceae bacterium]